MPYISHPNPLKPELHNYSVVQFIETNIINSIEKYHIVSDIYHCCNIYETGTLWIYRVKYSPVNTDVHIAGLQLGSIYDIKVHL